MAQIQVKDEIALVKNRRVQHVLSCSGSHAVYPLIAKVSDQVACSAFSPSITLFGCNVSHLLNTFHCRCQGAALPASALKLLCKQELDLCP